MSNGYIYAFSLSDDEGIYKIGYTNQTPESRLKSANSSTWSLSTFELAHSQECDNPRMCERAVFRLLERYRIHTRREFFNVSLKHIRWAFDLVSGNGHSFVGLSVASRLEDGIYMGRVISYDGEVWKVRYDDDGKRKSIDYEELLDALARYKREKKRDAARRRRR